MEISFLADSPDYSETIAQWYFEEWAEGFGVPLSSVVADVISKAISNTQIPCIMVAIQNDIPLGAVELKLYENKSLPYKYWLGGLYVNPSNRSNGVGNKLALFAMQKAWEFGVQSLYLQCLKEHQMFYQKLGFEPASHSTSGICVMVKHRESA